MESQDDHIIIEKEIPEIKQDIMYFFVSSNRSTAREKEKINLNGDWVVISKDHLDFIDHEGKTCTYEDQYIPLILRESGFRFAKKYSLTLPVTLQTQGGEVAFWEPQPHLLYTLSY